MDESVWKWTPPGEDAGRLASELGVPLAIAQVLVKRKIAESESARRFLYGSIDDLYDPFLMAGMEAAVERVLRAVEQGEKILIFGDYDADGVLSVVMLHKALESLGAKVGYFIPDRLRDGYGIKEEYVAIAVKEGARLVISVDCGIKAIGFVRKAEEIGIDVIITDHHLADEELPDALAVLNPVLKSSNYPDGGLAGVGVAFKLIQALFERRGRTAQLRHYLKLVSIGTVADVAKLKGENRIFVKYGLKELENVTNIGLKSLINVCGLKGKKISEGDIGFRLGPRINAAGRMGMTELAVRLFFSKSPEETAAIARRLDELNSNRQAAEEKIFKQAYEEVRKKDLDKSYKILILGCETWHRGIIGIVASRLKDAFCRPVILFSYDDGKAYGSGRSISEFSLIECLEECRNFFLTYGGHEFAVGCTLERESLPAFKQAANAVAESRITDEQTKRKIEIDAMLDFADISPSFLEYFSLLAPFGVGNPRPVFLAKNAEVVGSPQCLQGKHAKFHLLQNGRIFEAIGWNKGGWTENFKRGDFLDLAYSFQFTSYLGEEKLYLSLEGLRR